MLQPAPDPHQGTGHTLDPDPRPHDPLCLTRDRFVGPDRTDYSSSQFCVCGVRNEAVER
jgi:hypothetical protein